MSISSDWETNEAMQPHNPKKLRTWQTPQGGDYHYGECPHCGEAGESDVDDQDEEYFHCPSCGCEYIYETMSVYRYSGLDPDWSPEESS